MQATAQGTVDAILMASGFSKRFGPKNKLLSPFFGQPLASHALRLACTYGGFGKVFFVYAHPDVGALCTGFAATALKNNNPQRGSRESIRLGVLSSNADYYLFLQCDQPLLNAPTLDTILAARSQNNIVLPCHRGQPASPVLFSAAFRPQLLALAEGQHARELIKRHPANVCRVEIENPLLLKDVDTPKDLETLEKIAQLPPASG